MSQRIVLGLIGIISLVGLGTATAQQPQLKAPWVGMATITQGNKGRLSHNECGKRIQDPQNCAWENTYALDIRLHHDLDYTVPSTEGGTDHVALS